MFLESRRFALAGLLLLTVGTTHAEKVSKSELDDKTYSGIVRCRDCDPQDSIDLGMLQTGTEPVFPKDFQCPGIDDGWAMDYGDRRAKVAFHGGIDIPMPFGSPILSVADGEVVAMFNNLETPVGIRIFLRHKPEQTGLPFWTYSEYAHLQELPDLHVGQKVKRGDVVGLTSNTGISGQETREKNGGEIRKKIVRRPALHFSIMYSAQADYAVIQRSGGYLVPVNGRWMDPLVFFRGAPPYSSSEVAEMPSSDKRIQIPIQLIDGKSVPERSKLTWPYACSPRP
ncbi:MAG: M23 family metallopeptidase [Rhodoferax sp.]|nr:MAG: M23 family metallopeptidase [Rhodoferax sp.]